LGCRPVFARLRDRVRLSRTAVRRLAGVARPAGVGVLRLLGVSGRGRLPDRPGVGGARCPFGERRVVHVRVGHRVVVVDCPRRVVGERRASDDLVIARGMHRSVDDEILRRCRVRARRRGRPRRRRCRRRSCRRCRRRRGRCRAGDEHPRRHPEQADHQRHRCDPHGLAARSGHPHDTPPLPFPSRAGVSIASRSRSSRTSVALRPSRAARFSIVSRRPAASGSSSSSSSK